jgi:hypothetical protein
MIEVIYASALGLTALGLFISLTRTTYSHTLGRKRCAIACFTPTQRYHTHTAACVIFACTAMIAAWFYSSDGQAHKSHAGGASLFNQM